jgi:hypothetical protein
MIPWLLGRTITKTRGTATLDSKITAAGVHVNVQGWAEGTID